MNDKPRRFGRPTLDEAALLKARILDETLRAVRVGGSERLSINQLSKDAGVTKRTVYRHFGSKAGLIDAVIDKELTRLYELAVLNSEEDRHPLDDLRAFAKHLFDYSMSTDTVAFTGYLVLESANDLEIRSRIRIWHNRVKVHIEDLIKSAQQRRALIECCPGQLALIFMDLIIGAINRKRFNLEDEVVFGSKDVNAFFQSRWMAFVAVASSGLWSEWENTHRP